MSITVAADNVTLGNGGYLYRAKEGNSSTVQEQEVTNAAKKEKKQKALKTGLKDFWANIQRLDRKIQTNLW